MKNEKQKDWSNLKKSDLIFELNQNERKIIQCNSELTQAKDKDIFLNSEIRNLESEIKYLKEKITTSEILMDRLNTLDDQVRDLEDKLEVKEKKIEDLQIEKENLLKEKSSILESKSEILQDVKEKDLEIQSKSQKIEDLREKFKQSSSDLLSKSMQIDKLIKKDKDSSELQEKVRYLEQQLEENKKTEIEKVMQFEKVIKHLQNELDQKKTTGDEKIINNLEQKIKILENELGTSQTKVKNLENVEKNKILRESDESTRIVTNYDDLIKEFRNILLQGKSTIRMVLPEIEDLKKFELIDIIKKIPSKIRISICANIDDPIGNLIYQEVKNYCQMINYNEKNLIALNVDSSKFLIGIFKENNNILGIYTEILEFINLFKPAIMEPFIKGTKIS